MFSYERFIGGNSTDLSATEKWDVERMIKVYR